MNQRNGIQSTETKLHDRFLLSGQFISIIGYSILSVGKILQLFDKGQLPTSPLVEKTNDHNNTNSLYSGRKSYFD